MQRSTVFFLFETDQPIPYQIPQCNKTERAQDTEQIWNFCWPKFLIQKYFEILVSIIRRIVFLRVKRCNFYFKTIDQKKLANQNFLSHFPIFPGHHFCSVIYDFSRDKMWIDTPTPRKNPAKILRKSI